VRAPILCLVTSRRALTPEARTLRDEIQGLERQLDEAIAAGVELIQVREPGLEAGVLRDLVARVSGRAGGGTRVVVNDRSDVARAAGAGGVHLRADGPPASLVRLAGPPGWIITRSVHTADAARAAADADYALFGTVFPSRSKDPSSPVAGVAALGAAVRAASIPVLAIGGIVPARAPGCRETGAAGLAAIGLFLPPGRTPEALGVAEAARALRERWRETGKP
jgi:thiamine-phosphate diphosphorylase